MPETITLSPDHGAMFAQFTREIELRLNPGNLKASLTDAQRDAIHDLLGPIAIAVECAGSQRDIDRLRQVLATGLANVDMDGRRRDADEEVRAFFR